MIYLNYEGSSFLIRKSIMIKEKKKYVTSMCWIFKNPEQQEVEIINMREFCDKNELSYSIMKSLTNPTAKSTRVKHHRGWIFVRKYNRFLNPELRGTLTPELKTIKLYRGHDEN